MRVLFVAALCAAGLSSQIIRTPPPGNLTPRLSEGLTRYLQLTNEQVNTIARLNTELQRFQIEKSMRASQVQLELAREVQKETLDPMAIGLRQVELEAIRREIEARGNETSRQVQAQLNAEQRTRVAALQEVLRNYGLACEAVAHRILPGGGPITGAISAAPIFAPNCILPVSRIGGLIFNSTSEPTVSEP